MLGLSLSMGSSGGGGPSIGASGNDVTANEGDTIATREIGGLTIVLRNVLPAHESNPFIRCTFELQNRDLQRIVAVAANSAIAETGQDSAPRPTVMLTRSGLVDSLGKNWGVPKGSVKGMSEVFCFESRLRYARDITDERIISQNSPGAIVNYIRRGKHYDFSAPPGTGMFWGGTFSTIAPGKSIRLTMTYLPSRYLRVQSRNSTQSEPEFVWPQHFQLDLELVVGTFMDGEEPESSKDLALRNLTIDKVALPKPDAKGGR
jgi:hypothetical protein